MRTNFHNEQILLISPIFLLENLFCLYFHVLFCYFSLLLQSKPSLLQEHATPLLQQQQSVVILPSVTLTMGHFSTTPPTGLLSHQEFPIMLQNTTRLPLILTQDVSKMSSENNVFIIQIAVKCLFKVCNNNNFDFIGVRLIHGSSIHSNKANKFHRITNGCYGHDFIWYSNV